MKYTEIKTHEDACKALGRDTTLPDVSMRPEHHRATILADCKLMDIAEAINKLDGDYKANYSDTSQEKWYPYFDARNGFAFVGSYYVCWHALTTVGSRLCFRFRSEKAANHFGKVFNDLHRQSFGIII